MVRHGYDKILRGGAVLVAALLVKTTSFENSTEIKRRTER